MHGGSLPPISTIQKDTRVGVFLYCGDGARELLRVRAVVKGAVLFRHQAKPRAGVAELSSDGEKVSVTATTIHFYK